MNIKLKLRKYFCEEIYFYFLIKNEKIVTIKHSCSKSSLY